MKPLKKTILLLVSIVIVLIVATAILFYEFNLPASPPSSSSPSPSLTPTPKFTPSPSLSPPTTVVTVIAKDDYFSPANLTITVETTVQWINQGAVFHTSTSYDTTLSGSYFWNSGIIQRGQSYNHTFTTTGTYNYFCAVHPTTMFGQVVVNPTG